MRRFSDSLRRFSVRGKGQAVFHQGEPTQQIYFVCEGRVKLTRTAPSGDQVIVHVAAPCAVLNEVCQPESEPERCSAFSMDATTEVACVDAGKLAGCLDSFPSLHRGFCRDFSHKLSQAYWLIELRRRPVSSRLVAILTYLASLHPSTKDSRRVYVTMQELAEFAQATPESVSRALGNLKEQGLIQKIEKGCVFLQASITK